MSLDLPLIWAVIIALAVFLYVLLDGFDLGDRHPCSRSLSGSAPIATR